MKIASRSENCPNLATSKLLIAFKFPFDNRANLALVAPISPNRMYSTEFDMWYLLTPQIKFLFLTDRSRYDEILLDFGSATFWDQVGCRPSSAPQGQST